MNGKTACMCLYVMMFHVQDGTTLMEVASHVGTQTRTRSNRKCSVKRPHRRNGRHYNRLIIVAAY